MPKIEQSDCSPTQADAAQLLARVASDTGVSSVEKLKAAVNACVGDSLAQVEEHLRESLSSKYSSVRRLVDSALTMGGKRLRPMLVLLSAQAVPQAPNRPTARDRRDLIRIAAAVELVHTASLAHDDVMDHADNRRHQPTICNLEGNSAAILLGDFLFTRAYAVAANCRSPWIARAIAATSTELCEGELRQQLSIRKWRLPIKEYYDMLNQKTASLCSTSCRLGAWQVGGSREHQLALRRFGKLLGLAFQVHDDWLDYWGGGQTGKTLGTDLAQYKPTLPLLYYMRSADADARKQLVELLSNASHINREQAAELIRRSNADCETRQTAHDLALRSIAALQALPESPERSTLESIALFSVSRSV